MEDGSYGYLWVREGEMVGLCERRRKGCNITFVGGS